MNNARPETLEACWSLIEVMEIQLKMLSAVATSHTNKLHFIGDTVAKYEALRAVALNAAYALGVWPTDGSDEVRYRDWQTFAQKTAAALRKELGVEQVDAPVWTAEEIEAGKRLAEKWAYMFESETEQKP